MKKIFKNNAIRLGIVALVMVIGKHSATAAIIYSEPQDELLAHHSDESFTFSMGGASPTLTIEENRGLFFLYGSTSIARNTYFTFGEDRLVTAFEEGIEIGPSDDWIRSVTLGLARYEPEDDPRLGHFHDESDKFMAMRILDDNDELFGWVRMSHSMDDEEFIIHDWAWNSVPDEPIMAGEIPEPAAVGLFGGLIALGGAVLVRRGRKGRALARRPP